MLKIVRIELKWSKSTKIRQRREKSSKSLEMCENVEIKCTVRFRALASTQGCSKLQSVRMQSFGCRLSFQCVYLEPTPMGRWPSKPYHFEYAVLQLQTLSLRRCAGGGHCDIAGVGLRVWIFCRRRRASLAAPLCGGTGTVCGPTTRTAALFQLLLRTLGSVSALGRTGDGALLRRLFRLAPWSGVAAVRLLAFSAS